MAHFEKMLNQNESRAARSDSEKDALNDKLNDLRAAHSALEASARDLESKSLNLETQLADALTRGDTSAAELTAALEQLEAQKDQLSQLEVCVCVRLCGVCVGARVRACVRLTVPSLLVNALCMHTSNGHSIQSST